MDDRRFTAPVEEIAGTVENVSAAGVTLKEFPGRRFQFSTVGLSAADMSARILGEHNDRTRSLRPDSHQKPRAHAAGMAANYSTFRAGSFGLDPAAYVPCLCAGTRFALLQDPSLEPGKSCRMGNFGRQDQVIYSLERTRFRLQNSRKCRSSNFSADFDMDRRETCVSRRSLETSPTLRGD